MFCRSLKFTIFMCFFVIFLFLAGDTAVAENYDKRIDEIEEKQKEYERQSERLQQEMQEIELDKEDTLKYIEKLDKKTADVEGQLAGLKGQISQTEEKLEASRKELEAARLDEENQYTTMKQRIKYIYENGNQEYLEILFSADSMAELLNRTEYVEKISSYDKNVFDAFQRARHQVEAKENEIQRTLTNLEDMHADATAQKDALDDMRERKKEELASYNNSLKKTQEQADEYARQAAKAEAEVEKLLIAKQREIERKNDMGTGDSGNSGGNLRWPLRVQGRISSGFGKRNSPTAGASTYHKGIDIAVASGTPIIAAGSGTVETAAYSASAGNYVMISHGNRLYTVYMHCSRLVVKQGQLVRKGEVIAYVGSTGISTGSHLHFGVSKNGAYVNPLNYVSR